MLLVPKPVHKVICVFNDNVGTQCAQLLHFICAGNARNLGTAAFCKLHRSRALVFEHLLRPKPMSLMKMARA